MEQGRKEDKYEGCETMTLRELIISVDAEEYANVPLYQQLRTIKPEYGSNRRIEVRLSDGNLVVTNVHIGSLGDIVTYPINIDPDLDVTKVQLLDAILKEMSSGGFDDGEFWNEMTNLQKAKIIR